MRDRLRRDIYAAFTVRSLLPLAGAPRSAPVLFRLDDAALASRPKPVWQFPKFGFAFKARRYGGLAIQLRDFVGRCYFSRGRHIQRVTRTTPNELQLGGLNSLELCSSRTVGRCRTWFQPLG